MKSPAEPTLTESSARAQELIDLLGFQTIGARVRRQRLNQGISVRDLAARAHVNKNSVLRLERGEGSHPLTLLSVCSALCLHLDALALSGDKTLQIAAIQRNGGAVWHDLRNVASGPIDMRSPGDAIPIQLLASRFPTGRVVPTVIVVNQPTPINSHHGEEFVYVLEGQLRMTIADQPFILEKGESIDFWSAEAHRYEPVGETATILSVRVDY